MAALNILFVGKYGMVNTALTYLAENGIEVDLMPKPGLFETQLDYPNDADLSTDLSDYDSEE